MTIPDNSDRPGARIPCETRNVFGFSVAVSSVEEMSAALAERALETEAPFLVAAADAHVVTLGVHDRDYGNVLATPLPVLHAGVETYAYLLEAEGRSLVYMPDVKSIPAPSLERMKGVDLLIIDGLRYHLHPTHMCLEETLAAIAAVRPRRAVLTHLSHDMDYGILSGKLPENVMPAYDGLRLSLP